MEVASKEATTTAPELTQAQPSNLAQPERIAGSTAVATWVAPTWDAERINLAKKMLCPPGTTDIEFEYCMAWCRRTGLDPFIQQAYFVPRKAKDAAGKWIEKVVPMAAVAGFAARADAMPDFRGMRSGVVYAGDEFMVDEDSGIVTHKWSLEARTKAGNKLIGAWAHATRDGRFVPVTFLTVGERDPGNGSPFWAGAKAAGQIRKCAEAESYRKAFPNTFAGAYIEAEMQGPDEREINPAPEATSKAPTAKSEALKAKLGVKPVEQPKPVEPAQVPNPDAKAAGPSIPLDCVRFGPHKGTLIADLSTLELEASVTVANQALANATGKERWVPGVKEGIAAITAEIEKREAGGDSVDEADTTAPEPGSEG